jgi:hypothetical protein
LFSPYIPILSVTARCKNLRWAVDCKHHNTL